MTKANAATQPKISERLFVTIAGSDGTLPPAERLKSIYPRYTDGNAGPGADGLVVRSVPHQHALPGRGADLRSVGARAFPDALHAQRRRDARRVPA